MPYCLGQTTSHSIMFGNWRFAGVLDLIDQLEVLGGKPTIKYAAKAGRKKRRRYLVNCWLFIKEKMGLKGKTNKNEESIS